jgi:hypothetical protein
MTASGKVEVAGVPLTHPDRILWEEQGVTKQDLAKYYEEVARWVLPHVVHRPLSLVRCPSGSQKGCFFQKHSWAGLSGFIQRKTVRDADGEEEVLLVEDIRWFRPACLKSTLGARRPTMPSGLTGSSWTSTPARAWRGHVWSKARASCVSA